MQVKLLNCLKKTIFFINLTIKLSVEIVLAFIFTQKTNHWLFKMIFKIEKLQFLLLFISNNIWKKKELSQHYVGLKNILCF